MSEKLPEHSITISRVISAPSRDVYAAWTEQKMMESWLGKVSADVRLGGQYRIESPSEDGKTNIYTGQYAVLEDGRRVILTFLAGDPSQIEPNPYANEFIGIRLVELSSTQTEVTFINGWDGESISDEFSVVARAAWSEWLDRMERAVLRDTEFTSGALYATIRVQRLAYGDNDLAKALFALMAAVFKEEHEPLSGYYLDRLLKQDQFWAMAAFAGDDLVGGLTAHTLSMTRTETSEVFIYDIAVQEEHRRKGVGRHLVKALRQAVANESVQCIFVGADNADEYALDFYRALGGVPSPVTMFSFVNNA